MVSKVCWQLANKWILSLTTVCRQPSQPLGLLCIGQCFSQCWWKQMFLQWAAQFGSARPLRGLLYRSTTFFIAVWNIFPIWWKLSLQKTNVSLLPLHVFWQLKTNFGFWGSLALPVFFGWKLECQGPCWCKLSQNGPRQVSDLSENESKPTSTRFSPFLWPSFIFIPLSTNKEMKIRNSSLCFFHFSLLLNAPLKNYNYLEVHSNQSNCYVALPEIFSV